MIGSSSLVRRRKFLIDKLARQSSSRERRRLLLQHRPLHSPELVREIYEEMVRRARADLTHAERLAHTAEWLARRLRDDRSRAFAARAAGHIFYLRDNNQQALASYECALRLFEHAGDEHNVARTLNGGLQSLIYLGRYRKAFSWAQRARKIFVKHGDKLRLARLDTNLGNVLYRQDRFAEALHYYQRSLKGLERLGEPQDVAATLSNIAVCHITSGHFSDALRSYREARAYCLKHDLTRFVIQADYNVAYLHYLRGEYTRAIELYEKARLRAEELSDAYHRALCDLDQAEMYLELNLVEEGAQLAQHAFEAFQKLRMGYEAAKALAFSAIAHSRQEQTERALTLFRAARRRFVEESNRVWPALIDLYQALVLYQAKRFTESRKLSAVAYHFFSRSTWHSKTVLCQLLLARLELRRKSARLARRWCRAALRKLKAIEAPSLQYQAQFVLGQVEESLGNIARARRAYQAAHRGMEDLRSHLSGEELKISFLKDKLAVYESLVWLSLLRERGRRSFESAFRYMEHAKSRGLADLIAFQAGSLPSQSRANAPAVQRIRSLRESLHWHYRQLDRFETGKERSSPARLQRHRQETREQEAGLVREMTALRATEPEFRSLQSAATVSLKEVQSVIPPDTVLLEYYQARGTLFVGLIGRSRLEIQSLGPAEPARRLLRLLQFQFSKFRLGEEYVKDSKELLQAATESHLRELYLLLFAPVQPAISAQHLVIVPHGFLHYLPFQALRNDGQYLVDQFSISYAPSASVFYLCCTKRVPRGDHSLVLGIPDPLAPRIQEEAEAVASILPAAKLFVGGEATEECIHEHGPRCRFVHIATHGLFRQDNPMFSSLRLGRSQLTLFDLYGLHLPAELVTLSGCGTGLNVVVGGDELLGLVRGLLYAGAQSLLVTLWDVNDRSTAEFMKLFYLQLKNRLHKSVALRNSMLQLRQTYPHPYYWAPFALIGAPF